MRVSLLASLLCLGLAVAVPTPRSSLPRPASRRSQLASRAAVPSSLPPASARPAAPRPLAPRTSLKLLHNQPSRPPSPPQTLRPRLSARYPAQAAAAKKRNKSAAHNKPKPLTGGEIHRRRRGSPDQGVLVDKSSEAPWYSFSFHGPDGLHYNNGKGYLLGYNYRDGHRYRNRPRRGNSYENREDFHYKDGNYYAYF